MMGTGEASGERRALLSAEAAIANLKARKALQHAQIAQAENAILATQADVGRTRQEAARQRALLATTYGTQQRVEQANADEKRFTATLARNESELDGQRRQLAVLDTQELQLRAEAKAKQAALDLAKINLGYTDITTPITGKIRERSNTALDLAIALHPTPAVGGVPAAAAADLINELEGDRGFYAGAIGWCDQRGDGRWVVSIRGAQLSADRRTADAHSGGGIVAESDPDDEVAETTTKFNTILSALGVQP